MKLVDILARELKVWPDPLGEKVGQYRDGELHGFAGDGHPGCTTTQASYSKCDNWIEDTVTRAEWQAAVDALNAPKVVEWDGVGLPPVGAECEMKRLDYVDVDWQQIKFLCAGGKKAFFMDSEGYEWSRPLAELKFRPIRTADQVAAEEREKAITLMIDESLCGHYAFTKAQAEIACKALYEAGYRKEPKPCGY